MSTVATVIGLDIGTTTSKALLRSMDDDRSLVSSMSTPWQTTADGGRQLDPDAVLQLAIDLVSTSVRAGEAQWGTHQVLAISVAGLGESGVVVAPSGTVKHPAIAWFDRRGSAELDTLSRKYPEVRDMFPAVTGLPWSFQASIGKLLWLTATHPIPAGSQWLNVPEWIVYGLGGERVCEPSLASRIGLIRQADGTVWTELAELAGLPAGFIPDCVPAGTPAGTAVHRELPSAARGAVLSVAGHDHPIAALAVGAAGSDDLFNSAGTADVLARSVSAPLSDAQRERIVAAGWSAGAHVLPGLALLLGGGSGGLLLRRVLGALGAGEAGARAALDTAGLLVRTLPPGLSVRGDGRTDDGVQILFGEDADPATIWVAATRHTARLAADMLADVAPVVGAHQRAVAAGGWVAMASVRRARSATLHNLTFSDLRQPGATGAALLAAYSLDADQQSLTEFLDTRPRLAVATP